MPLKPTAEELFGPAGTPRVVVVGAGFGGIATGVKLRRAGIHTFTIYESSLGIGGTWWDNTYPGAEVDVGSHLYCFSFKPHDWTRTHAKQPELQKYLEETVDEFGLRPHLRLGVTVESATWDDDRHVWTVRLDDGTVDECHVLVSGVGFLNVPRYPDWPGLDDFAGTDVPHRPLGAPARPDRQGRGGRRHGLVGHAGRAGHPADRASSCYVFQREPGWVMPKGERDFDRRRARRLRRAVAAPAGALAAEVPAREEPVARAPLPAGHQDQHGARAALPPLHRPPVRRPSRPARGRHAEVPVSRQAAGLRQHVLSRAQEANVELVPQAVASVTRTGIVDTDGVERAVDVIVMATGFQPANYLARLPRRRPRRPRRSRSTGRASRAPTSASPCPGFPNFFMLYGPGTNGGEIVIDAREPGRVRRARDQAHDARARHRGRGEAGLRGAVVPLAPVEDGRHVVDDDATTTSSHRPARS